MPALRIGSFLKKTSTHGVEVIVAGSFPAMVTSFATEEVAEAWITDYKRQVAAERYSSLYAGKKSREPERSFGRCEEGHSYAS